LGIKPKRTNTSSSSEKLVQANAALTQLQSTHARSSEEALPRQAAILAKSGQYIRAMEIYRKLYGNNPPAGDITHIYFGRTSSRLASDIKVSYQLLLIRSNSV
jgi:hypothetical protein